MPKQLEMNGRIPNKTPLLSDKNKKGCFFLIYLVLKETPMLILIQIFEIHSETGSYSWMFVLNRRHNEPDFI